MPLIRKHAAPLALLAALLCAFAAPFLIPDNPDSAVFRSGTFSCVLLAAAAFPAWEALRRADRRTLIFGLLWGLLLAAALGTGAELLVYNGLLPGSGSLLRRLAVPVMAAPLLGLLCARAMLAQPKAPEKPVRFPVWGYGLVLLLCWLPILLAYFPGMLNYDFPGEYGQHLEGGYSSLHPLLHSALVNGVITLGESLHSRTFGLFLMTILQMTLFAAALAYACAFAQRRGASRMALAAMTALFGLHPVFSVMALSMTKDTLFAAALLVFSLLIWEACEEPAAFFRSRGRLALCVMTAVGTALMRNNGIFALALMLPALVIASRGWRKCSVLLSASCAGMSMLVLLALNLALSPSTERTSFQLYSLPAQQLVRAYNNGSMSEADKEELEGWYTDKLGLAVHPHLADGAKGYLDRGRIEAEGRDFLSLWARNGKTCAKEYLEAFLMLNVGLWYPDDLSHSTIYPDASYNDKGYLQTQEYDMTEYGLHTTSLLPKVRNFMERICRRNRYQKYPIVSLLFGTATPFWALMLVCALLAARKRMRLLPAVLGALGMWLSYLFGPCTLPRYVLPLFCLAPPLLAGAFLPARKEDDR